MSEVEETLKRINSHKGVQGIVIMNMDAVPIRSTMDPTLATKYASQIKPLADKSRSVVRDLDPQNDLTFLRIRSKKHEILVRAASLPLAQSRRLTLASGKRQLGLLVLQLQAHSRPDASPHLCRNQLAQQTRHGPRRAQASRTHADRCVFARVLVARWRLRRISSLWLCRTRTLRVESLTCGRRGSAPDREAVLMGWRDEAVRC